MITWPIFLGLFMALTLMYFSNKKEDDAEKKEIYDKEMKEAYEQRIKEIAERNKKEMENGKSL